MKQRTFPILAVLLLAAALSGCQSTAAGDSAGLSIHFIDPGQTSSALLLCGGQAMLIDGGSAERGSQVAGYLSQQGITYLDYVVCTSADETHMGGLSGPFTPAPWGRYSPRWMMLKQPVFADFRRYTEAQGLSPPSRRPVRYSPGDAQVTVVETDAAAQTLSLQVDYGDTSLQFTSDLEDAVAAVASEAEGSSPGRSGGRKRRYPVFPPRPSTDRALTQSASAHRAEALFGHSRCPHPRGCRPHQPRQKTEWAPRPGVFRPRYCFFVCHSGSPGRRRSSILTYIRITCIIQL
ncbi:hypothetical protein M5E87_23820 [Flavonifractor plautii]|nr:hypothetical protein M5E87_23820 [Flavonifractor plautii]